MTEPAVPGVEDLRADRDQWRELARLEAENARKADARALAAEAALAEERERPEKQPSREEWPPYRIREPDGGWRAHGSFGQDEKAKLRPIAETLAMLDGNAFFGNEVGEGQEWYEQYLPEAYALYDGNGGDDGWAGEASFARAAAIRAQGE